MQSLPQVVHAPIPGVSSSLNHTRNMSSRPACAHGATRPPRAMMRARSGGSSGLWSVVSARATRTVLPFRCSAYAATQRLSPTLIVTSLRPSSSTAQHVEPESDVSMSVASSAVFTESQTALSIFSSSLRSFALARDVAALASLDGAARSFSLSCLGRALTRKREQWWPFRPWPSITAKNPCAGAVAKVWRRIGMVEAARAREQSHSPPIITARERKPRARCTPTTRQGRLRPQACHPDWALSRFCSGRRRPC